MVVSVLIGVFKGSQSSNFSSDWCYLTLKASEVQILQQFLNAG